MARSVVKHVALFGGTFDPLHVGHLAIAEAARRAIDGEVVFVPTGRNPLKDAEPTVPAEDRYEMVRRSLYAAPGMRADRRELDRDGPSHTIDTVREYSRGGAHVSFILGADALAEIGQWHESRRLLELTEMLVAKRPGAAEPDRAALREVFDGARVRVLDAPLVDLSSRELRAFARSGGSLRYLVPEPAWRYMVAKGLYGQVERR